MRFLANENISRTLIQLLRARNHDVLSVKESMRGQPDQSILLRAQQEDRLLLTMDKDFGELAFRSKLAAECGIVLLRLLPEQTALDNAHIVTVLESRDDWKSHFSVITGKLLRMRKI